MSENLTCAQARDQLALLLYGELSFHEEECVESHLEGCAECRAALEREKAVHAALDSVAIEPASSLLRDCRADLAARVADEPALAGPKTGWWDQLVDSLTGGSRIMLRPAGVVALLAIGFFAARFTPGGWMSFSNGAVTEAGMAHVRDVQRDASGRVRIVLDETRQRTVYGSLDDRQIQALLIQAMSDSGDPGLRAQSVDLLNAQQARSNDVRDLLILALNDQDDGVRFKAIEGLKDFAQDQEVQTAVSKALLADTNPGIRMKAIDLLTQGSGENLNRQVIGTLQQLMEHEDNSGLRQRCERVLASFNASPGIY